MSAVILVVEDNPASMKLARVLLGSAGYRVVGAGDAKEAIRVLEHTRPDIIVMDLQLPGVDGFELTRRIRRDPGTREIPIIALTAYAMKGDEQRALAAGCNEYVTKPIDTTAFLQRIALALDRARG